MVVSSSWYELMCIDYLTLCGGVKTVRVTRVDSWEVVPKYLRNGLEYSDQTLHADRYYGRTGAGSLEFMTFRMGAAWKRGKICGFLSSFPTVDFVLALHTAAKRM